MKKRKYTLTDESIEYEGKKLYRIKASVSFLYYHKGDLGGYVENEYNLSQDGLCWIADNAKVMDYSRVEDNALVAGEAIIKQRSSICGTAIVNGNALVSDESVVRDWAGVTDTAQILNSTLKHQAIVTDGAIIKNYCISGQTKIGGDAIVSQKGDYMEFTSLYDVFDRPIIWTRSNDRWETYDVSGSAEEVLEYYSHKRSKACYRLMKTYIETVEEIKKLQKRYG